jgi:RNA polymerase sigma factor (sigma-70 family)
MMDDNSYVRRICAGEEDVFRLLIRSYQEIAFNIAVSVVKDEFVSQEVVQDAFVKVYKNLRSFNHQSKFSTWLYRIVTNEALMRLRKMKKDPLRFLDNLPEEADIAEEETQIMVNKALQLLPPNESLSIRLFYLQEENIKTVSEITGWTASNTKTILHRARKHLMAILRELIKEANHDGI